MKYKWWTTTKTRPPKTFKCPRSKTIRPRKLKSSHHVDLMKSTWCELFSFLCLIVLYLEHFKVLDSLFCLFVHPLFTLYGLLYISLSILLEGGLIILYSIVMVFINKTTKRDRSIRPRKLKSSHHVDLMRSTWCELFSFLCLNVLEYFKILGSLVFCLFTLYSHCMVCFIFPCLSHMSM